MVNALLDPLNIVIAALGAGFLLPLFHRWRREAASVVFYGVLAYLVMVAGVAWWQVLHGAPAFELYTAGLKPPLSINLRLGVEEGLFVLFVNLMGLLGGWYLFRETADYAAKQVLFLILVMGIDGMIMTRDLFNIFIFMEITAIATYGLLAMEQDARTLGAGFKYIIATALASTFFLLGTILFYFLTGTLNIEDMLAHQAQISGPVALAGGALIFTGLLIELKPYPANGWGLDVYQTAPAGLAAMISVGVSAAALFAMYKALPLIQPFVPVLIIVGVTTFAISNLMGLKQDNPQRLLGYSSIDQIALVAAALGVLAETGAQEVWLLVVGGLFLNHFLAKAALFWLAGAIGRDKIQDWRGLSLCNQFLFAVAVAALVGFPPFPGFWAKWELLMRMGANGMGVWIGVILIGSLLEAAYLFRWFGYTLAAPPAGLVEAGIATGSVTASTSPAGGAAAGAASENDDYASKTSILIFTILLFVAGYYFTRLVSGIDTLLLLLPLFAGALFYLLDWIPLPQIKGSLAVAVLAGYAVYILPDLQGISFFFGLMLSAGGALLALAALYRGGDDPRRGFYPLLVMMVLSLGTLVQASTSLEFFFAWEIMTLSSYFLLVRRPGSAPKVLNYLLFSLGAAFFILAGFAVAYGASGTTALTGLAQVGEQAWIVWLLLSIGFLAKLGALGVHIWLPDAYAEAEDDVSAMLSAVVSKAAVFGMVLAIIHLPLQGIETDAIAYLLGWLGLITALVGALLAAFQEDMKRLLAYSSMGQLGYVVAALAMTTHLGWTTALYITFTHVLFKGLLFLAVAGVIYRTGTSLMYKTGGLINNMPGSFVAALVGIFAISGVPPMSGFAAKWMFYHALLEKGWYLQAGLAFFASAVAFLYLFRLIHSVFLGQRKLEHKDLKEAPIILLVPQALLLVGIMVVSFYPASLIDPASALAAAYFPDVTLHWEGYTLTTKYGYWNPTLMLAVIIGVTAVPFLALLFFSRFLNIQWVKQFNIVYAAERPETPQTTHYAYNFYSFYQRAIGFLVPPKATAFWRGAAEWTHTVGGMLRGLYTGNGQTYALHIVLFLVVVYFSAGAI